MHNIFVLTCNPTYVEIMNKYYNIHNLPTKAKLTLIIDDKRIPKDSIPELMQRLPIFSDYILMSDMIEFVGNTVLKNSKHFKELVNFYYKVSVKLIVFIYVKLKLGIDKSFMMDDDILFLKPIDSLFDNYNYAIKKDTLSNFNNGTYLEKKIKTNIETTYYYVDNVQMNIEKFYINSGTILFTWTDSIDIVKTIFDFFNSDKIYYMIKEKYISDNKPFKFLGRMWVTEQYIYSILLFLIHQSNTVNDIDNKTVFLHTRTVSNTNIKISKDKLPNLIHILSRDKMPIFQKYIEVLNG